MKLISYSKQKPTESGDYFVVGKKGSKAVLYYDAEKDTWAKGYIDIDLFSDEDIEWLDEVGEQPKPGKNPLYNKSMFVNINRPFVTIKYV